MPTLLLDANGMPRGHYDAIDAASNALRQWVNDLPESVYFLNRTDAEDVTDVMVRTYLTAIKRAQQ
jgi:tryptophan synthase beta subunit